MDANKRKLAESYYEQAGNHLSTARERVKSSYTIPEAVQSAQLCVELSVKAVLIFLDLEFSKAHGWGEKQMQALAEEVCKRRLLDKLAAINLNHTVNLPRLFMLTNFWGEFYLLAKYGMEAGSLATPKELFQDKDAELAIHHAEECERAATAIRYLDQEQLDKLLG